MNHDWSYLSSSPIVINRTLTSRALPPIVASDCKWRSSEFYFIECFTTTFLRAHSWLNWVDEDDDEDEVGLKGDRLKHHRLVEQPVGTACDWSNY